MSEKSCILAAFFSAIRYYLCEILPAKSCKICAKTTAKSRWKNVIERSASALFFVQNLSKMTIILHMSKKSSKFARKFGE